jgi:hypothetical protein
MMSDMFGIRDDASALTGLKGGSELTNRALPYVNAVTLSGLKIKEILCKL